MSGSGPAPFRVASDKPFLIGLGILGSSYLIIIAAMVLADLVFLDYGDKAILGPEQVPHGRYADEQAMGAPVSVEKGRHYFYRAGKNEAGLDNAGQRLTRNGLFKASASEVTLLPRNGDAPVTGSLQPVARVVSVTVTNGVATLTTDVQHRLIWSEFIRLSDAGDWNGVHEITDTGKTEILIATPAGAAPATVTITKPNPIIQALRSREIQFSIKLSLISCTLTTLLSLWVAVPIGYVMSRFQFRGKTVIDTLLDIPIVLPPLVVGLSLLILFRYMPDWLSDAVVYKWPAVVLAQFMVACAFAVRTMRVTFDQIPQRYEQVALTLGCNR